MTTTFACPACQTALREFQGRLACDRCEGMMVTLADLTAAIEEITGIVPTLVVNEQHAGTRPCPRCRAAMTACHVQVQLQDEVAKPRPELDRCHEHGFWFDNEELATVFEKCLGKFSHKGPPMGWTTDVNGFTWWNGGAMH